MQDLVIAEEGQNYTLTLLEVQYGTPRSPNWPSVRKAHIAKEPACRACGGKTNLEVHHIKPFHLFPDLELVDSNLITLCMELGHSCHFMFGHLLNYQAYNLSVVPDASHFFAEVQERKTA